MSSSKGFSVLIRFRGVASCELSPIPARFFTARSNACCVRRCQWKPGLMTRHYIGSIDSHFTSTDNHTLGGAASRVTCTTCDTIWPTTRTDAFHSASSHGPRLRAERLQSAAQSAQHLMSQNRAGHRHSVRPYLEASAASPCTDMARTS